MQNIPAEVNTLNELERLGIFFFVDLILHTPVTRFAIERLSSPMYFMYMHTSSVSIRLVTERLDRNPRDK